MLVPSIPAEDVGRLFITCLALALALPMGQAFSITGHSITICQPYIALPTPMHSARTHS